MHIVILAGGNGVRLWPLSRPDLPKQFIHFGKIDSLLKQTVKRFLGRPFVQSILVTTNRAFERLVREELNGLNVHILVEPCAKNTAPAIGFALRYLETYCHLQPDEPILISPSDHIVEPQEVFVNALMNGLKATLKGQVVTYGILPTRPETGYGYILIGKSFDACTFHVEKFVEKPDLTCAQEYYNHPNYYWNSGLVALTADVFWTQAKVYYPEIGQLREMSGAKLQETFQRLQPISFDYAFLEQMKTVVVCPLPVSWVDVGSWESVYNLLPKDSFQNVKIGQVVDLDTKNCLIMGDKRLIATIGLEDLVIIDTDEALLISKKTDSQRVREIVQRIHP